MKQSVSFSLSKEALDVVKYYAETYNRSKSNMLEIIIMKFKEEKGNK